MKKAMFVIPCIFSVALSLMNCSSPENTTTGDFSEYPVKIENLDGIKTVMNPDYPRDGRIIYRISDDTTLGPETGPEETIVFSPRSIRVDALGNAYILDAEDIIIKIYDMDGNWIRNVGHRGQGPGEYMAINDFDITEDGNIYILDLPQRRITVITNKGKFVSSFSLRGYGDKMRVDETGFVYCRGLIRRGIDTLNMGNIHIY
jgi:sugar lactone lactonase YvrE